MPYTRQELEERYKALPEVLKDALLSVEVANKIFGIGNGAALTTEEIGSVADETGYVMLGLTHPQDFIAHIAERLDINTEEAEGIALEINRVVFAPIREALRTYHGVEVSEEEMRRGTAPPLETQPLVSRPEPVFRPPQPPQAPYTQTPPPPRPATAEVHPVERPLSPPAPPARPAFPPPPKHPPPPHPSEEEIRPGEEKPHPPINLPTVEPTVPSWIGQPQRESRVPPIDLRNQRPAVGAAGSEPRPVGREARSQGGRPALGEARLDGRPVPPPPPSRQPGYDRYRESVE